MTENALTVLIVFASIAITILGVAGLFVFKSVSLKKEQIKADALVRSEEIKAKNQLDLERLIRKDLENSNAMSFSTDDRKVREKV